MRGKSSREQKSRPDWEGIAVLCRSADGQSVLMVLQGGPHEEPAWAVPGGSIEVGERPRQAAVREAREETGLDLRVTHPYEVIEGAREYGAYRVHYFVAEVAGGEKDVVDPNGLIHRVRWIPADALSNLRLSHEDQRHILLEFMEVSR
ncbi:MAG: NUDIX hydrolase [Anaerolineae bacterium]|jgi:8-oxo-dGTP pyrophosphatase MutT (NUDIX family)